MNELFAIGGSYEVEVIRIVYLLSLIASLIIYYKQEHAPGGMITAGLVALMLHQPYRILILLFTTFLILPVEQFVEKKVLKQKILVASDKLLIRVIISILLSACFYTVVSLAFSLTRMNIIGAVAPALLASTVVIPSKRKETIRAFLLAVLVNVCIYFLVKYVYLHFVTVEYLNKTNEIYSIELLFDYWSVMIMYVLLLCISSYNLILRRYSKIQPIGLMVGGYLGLFILQPPHLLFILVVSTVSIAIVKIISSYSLLFGYRLFVLASLVSASIYILGERFLIVNYSFYPLHGLVLAGIMITSIFSVEFSQNLSRQRIFAFCCLLFFSGTMFLCTYFIASSFLEKKYLPYVHKEFILSVLDEEDISPRIENRLEDGQLSVGYTLFADDTNPGNEKSLSGNNNSGGGGIIKTLASGNILKSEVESRRVHLLSSVK